MTRPFHDYIDRAQSLMDAGFGTKQARMIAAAPDALALARQVIQEVECYCADHVASPGPCAHCVAKSFISKATGVP